MNYASVIFVFVIGASVLYYQLLAKHWFTGPGRSIELPADSYASDTYIINERLHHQDGLTQPGTSQSFKDLEPTPSSSTIDDSAGDHGKCS